MHTSCCAVHNEPYLPAGPCDCGLVEAAIAGMMEESGLAEHIVRPMVEMEAARCPASLPFLARKRAHG